MFGARFFFLLSGSFPFPPFNVTYAGLWGWMDGGKEYDGFYDQHADEVP